MDRIGQDWTRLDRINQKRWTGALLWSLSLYFSKLKAKILWSKLQMKLSMKLVTIEMFTTFIRDFFGLAFFRENNVIGYKKCENFNFLFFFVKTCCEQLKSLKLQFQGAPEHIGTWGFMPDLKFIYLRRSEKATKFCEIFTLLLSYVVPVKVRWRFRKILWPSQNI